MINSRSMHVVAKNNIISFFFMANIPLYICICHIFIHSSVGGCLGGFHALAVVNSVAMNWGTSIFLNYGFLWLYAQEWDCWIIW